MWGVSTAGSHRGALRAEGGLFPAAQANAPSDVCMQRPSGRPHPPPPPPPPPVKPELPASFSGPRPLLPSVHSAFSP